VKTLSISSCQPSSTTRPTSASWVPKVVHGLLLATTVIITCQTATAATPKLCVPPAQGVPYWGGAPNWWGSYADANQERLAKSYDQSFRLTQDPRWRGALSVDYEAGATSPAEFRALYDNTSQSVLLSWSIKGMAFNLGQTAVVLGMQMGAGTPIVLKTSIQSASTLVAGQVLPKSANDGGTTFLSFSAYDTSGASVPVPTWASDVTRVWIMPSPSGASQPGFTLQMRIPTGGATNFNMWYSMQASVPLDGDPGLAAFTWPKGDVVTWSFYDTIAPVGKHIPPLASWGAFGLGNQASCTGVSLATGDIGVMNGQFPSSRGRISITQPNTFFALPKNQSTAPADLSSLKATFYFANWGSQRGDLTSDSWSLLTPNLVGQAVQSLGSPSTIDPTVALNPASTPSMSKVQIAPQWTLGRGEACRFFVEGSNPARYLAEEAPNGTPGFCAGLPAPTLNPHGCMMVKLNGNTEFLNDSALRNMDFEKASTFSRTAEIRTAKGARDVFLFVDMRNMPAHGAADILSSILEKAQQADGRTALAGSVSLDAMSLAPWRATSAFLKEPDSLASAVAATPSNDVLLGKVLTVLASGNVPKLSYEEFASILPTYAVHAYNDTGRRIVIDGVTHIAMEQQTSFGHFIWHVGPLFGWDINLSGIERLKAYGGNAPSAFKVHVADGGSATIGHSITAAETPLTRKVNCTCGTLCKSSGQAKSSDMSSTLAGSMALLGVVGVGGASFRRSPRRGAKR